MGSNNFLPENILYNCPMTFTIITDSKTHFDFEHSLDLFPNESLKNYKSSEQYILIFLDFFSRIPLSDLKLHFKNPFYFVIGYISFYIYVCISLKGTYTKYICIPTQYLQIIFLTLFYFILFLHTHTHTQSHAT